MVESTKSELSLRLTELFVTELFGVEGEEVRKALEVAKKALQEYLKEDAMNKMHAADLDPKNRKLRNAACEAVLIALRNEVELDASDPVFERFKERRWQTTMDSLCETVEWHITSLAKGVANLIPYKESIKKGMQFIGLKRVADLEDEAKEFNHDVWDPFFDKVQENVAQRKEERQAPRQEEKSVQTDLNSNQTEKVASSRTPREGLQADLAAASEIGNARLAEQERSKERIRNRWLKFSAIKNLKNQSRSGREAA